MRHISDRMPVLQTSGPFPSASMPKSFNLCRMLDRSRRCKLFSGTGQRVKLLEAFAMGVPVITTSLGAAGFPVVNRKHAVIANNAVEFRAAVADLAASLELRSRLGREARRMILEHFTWESIGAHFLDL